MKFNSEIDLLKCELIDSLNKLQIFEHSKLQRYDSICKEIEKKLDQDEGKIFFSKMSRNDIEELRRQLNRNKATINLVKAINNVTRERWTNYYQVKIDSLNNQRQLEIQKNEWNPAVNN